jgi:hypothetical protein
MALGRRKPTDHFANTSQTLVTFRPCPVSQIARVVQGRPELCIPQRVETNRTNILECNPDGSDLQIYDYGIRNPVFLAFDPKTKNLWTRVNERDYYRRTEAISSYGACQSSA